MNGAGLNIAFFGSSLVSAYWNGAATYYRGVIRALHKQGHRVTFFEPDAFDRQQHRDMDDPEWARVVVYPATAEGWARSVEAARGSDVVVKASGVGVFDVELEAAVLSLRTSNNQIVFWDVDAPATLDRLAHDPGDAFHRCVSQYDLVFTYGGGPPVVSRYLASGARHCVPIYNGLDPDTHHPVPPNGRFAADLAFMGNRLPDREARVRQFFLEPAAKMPEKRFLLGGNGWDCDQAPSNVQVVGHVYTRDHNAFNCTPKATLNISRDSMARCGYSPATRVFEAAGAGACLITDAWEGAEEFFEPNAEWLLARNGDEVVSLLESLTEARAREIGAAAYRRVLADHTYTQRAAQVQEVLTEGATV